LKNKDSGLNEKLARARLREEALNEDLTLD
jgi:hypothetical protein